MADNQKEDNKKSLFPWKTFFVLAIPVFLLGSISAAQVTGVVDFTQYLRQVPVVGALFPEKEEEAAFQQTFEEYRIAQLEEEKAEMDAQLRELQQQLAWLEPQEDLWNQEKDELEEELKALQEQLEISLEQSTQTTVDQQGLVERLALMKPANAAKIMENLPDHMVNSLLSEMDVDEAARIMALFDPLRAARLAYPDINIEIATQDGSQQAVQERSATLQSLGRSLAAMQPDEASMLIENLSNDIAVAIMKEMNDEARGKILSSLSFQNPARAAQLVTMIGQS
ncbi:hypothetical protein F9B85_01530 [Heliorestis acidaminivorans]|uniref:Magnesium transporter MgtE intracellular domain-containing protein n=1 Tax=Heliorestis acidaminivorans TaxID=553427 RepID=A0A6I0EVH6_9FIRM|nr:hypothetical protein [Heliorestis acidaminivorans]KAB2954394.1 hypothetical protein F9B85_01530 [Heliorestis acidaminivorans]